MHRSRNRWLSVAAGLAAAVLVATAAPALANFSFSRAAQDGTGVIHGTVTDAGQPLAGAFVFASSDSGGSGSAFTTPDGAYSLSLAPGTYVVSFGLPNGLTQFAHEHANSADSDHYVVTAGGDTVLDESVLPTGTVSGHLLDHDGNPVANATAGLDNDEGMSASAVVADDGSYRLTAFVGTYRLSFNTPFGVEWADQKASAGQSDPVVVSGDQTTVVDETLATPGSITVTARDSGTKAPIAAFCVLISVDQACTTNGSVELPTVLPGRYGGFVTGPGDDDTYLPAGVNGIVVSSGAPTSVAVTLDRPATVKTTVIDGQTGAAIANACLDLVPITQPFLLGTGNAVCSDPAGRISFGGLRPGSYKPFVHVSDGVHGDQWVGDDGGAGAFSKAKTVTVTAGATVNIAPVRLDKAGAIAGTMTDAATGKPIDGGLVELSSIDTGIGAGGFGTFTDASGHYTLGGLGPYQWTLFSEAFGYAAVFSGGVSDRNQAADIKVKVGRTTTYDIAMQRGTTVTGTVIGPDGTRATFARITFVNARTGDEMGSGDLSQGTYTAHIAGPQQVKLRYEGQVKGDVYSGWVGGTDFASATVLTIPASGTDTIDVRMTQLKP